MQTSTRSSWLFYAIFFATGIATVLMGNTLPRLHAPDATAGLLLAMQFIGQLCGPLFVGRKPARSVLAGLLLASATALVLARPVTPHPALLALYGLGLGISMTGVSIVAGLEVQFAERNRRMQLLNVFWPLGAASAPWFIQPITRAGLHVLRSYAALSALLLVLALIFALRMSTEPAQQDTAGNEAPHLPWPRFVFICLFATLAVGVEASLANWMPTYAARYITASAAGIATSAFWAGILSGRIVADRFLRRTSWKIFGITCALLCALAATGVSHSRTAALLAVTSFAAAFFVSPLYPAVLAHSVHARWRNLVFVAGGCGSALVPWIIGRTSTATASLRTALLVPVATAGLLALSMAIGIRNEDAHNRAS